MGPAHVENVAHLACRTALAYRGVAHINFPVDLQEQPVGERSKRNVPGHTSDVFARSARLPDDGDLRRAAEILERGQEGRHPGRPGRARRDRRAGAGGGAAGGADRQGAARQGGGARRQPVHHRRRSACSARKPSQEALEECDTLLMVGTSFPYIEFLPEARPGAGRADRPRPDAHRPALSGRGRPRRRQPAHAARAAAAARAARRTAASSRRPRRACGSGGS